MGTWVQTDYLIYIECYIHGNVFKKSPSNTLPGYCSAGEDNHPPTLGPTNVATETPADTHDMDLACHSRRWRGTNSEATVFDVATKPLKMPSNILDANATSKDCASPNII